MINHARISIIVEEAKDARAPLRKAEHYNKKLRTIVKRHDSLKQPALDKPPSECFSGLNTTLAEYNEVVKKVEQKAREIVAREPVHMTVVREVSRVLIAHFKSINECHCRSTW